MRRIKFEYRKILRQSKACVDETITAALDAKFHEYYEISYRSRAKNARLHRCCKASHELRQFSLSDCLKKAKNNANFNLAWDDESLKIFTARFFRDCMKDRYSYF